MFQITNFTVGNTGASKKLVKHKPLTTLLSRPILCSLFGQLAIAIFFQIAIWFDLHQQPWYHVQWK
jgi:hypothetical protein